MVVLYSTAWTGDVALADALVELLIEELSKNGVTFKVVERKWSDTGLSKLLGELPQNDVVTEIEVDESQREAGEKCLEAVYSDVKRLKEKVLFTAKTKYIRDESEFEEYKRGVEETYGW